MGRSFASVIVLAVLVLLGGCLQMAPRSSVPFQAAADRQARYAAEITLAVKEDRRAELSEAAANGRMVLPQLPEIWGPPGGSRSSGPAARALALVRLDSRQAGAFADEGCPWPGNAPLPADCRQGWRGTRLLLPPVGDASIAPAAAPLAP